MKYVISNPGKYGTHPAIKFSDTNIGSGKGFDTYPLYAAAFMVQDSAPMIIPAVDVSNLTLPTDTDHH